MAQKTITRDFQAYCEEIVEKYRIPGFMIGLAKDGETFYEAGFGYRDVEEKLPLSSDTVLGIGSVTKSFTCVAIMQLQEAGKLSVHDPVIKFLPEFKTKDEAHTKEITIHHFMTHTAGLPPLSSLYGAMKNSMDLEPKFADEEEKKEAADAEAKPELKSIDTYADLMENIANEEYTLLGPPGTEFSYSNDGYALLGAIIEKASGIPYEQYVKEYILDPAGMKNSVFHLEELEGHDDVASLYNERKKGDEKVIFKSNNPWDAPSMRAAGFLKSTVNDMLRYAEIYRNKGKVGDAEILSPESVEAMMTPYIECGHGTYYGYGVMITPDFFGYKLVEHGGAIKGVAAQMNILPEVGLTGFSNANLAGVPSTKLLLSAFQDVLEKPVTASHLKYEVIEQSVEELKEYEGIYASGEGAKYAIRVEDGKLNLKTEDMHLDDLKPIGNDTFIASFREVKMALRFIRGEDNKIIRASFGFRQIPKVQ